MEEYELNNNLESSEHQNFIKRNLLKIEVYYEELNTEQLTEQPKYPVSDMFLFVSSSPAFLTKVSLSCLLLVLEVCNVQPTFRKSYAANLLVMSDLTLELSLEVKLGRVHIRRHIWRIIGSRGF